MKTKTTTRRAVLADAAAVPLASVVTAPSVARSGADPIFAVIEAHRAAHASYVAAVDRNHELQEKLRASRRKSDFDGDDNLCVAATDDPDWIASERGWHVASAAEDSTALMLVELAPTTLIGVAALLRYSVEHIEGGGSWPDPESGDPDDGTDWSFFLHRNLADALAALGAS
jgi:hypothetical protein